MVNKICTCAINNGFYIAYDPILERNECKPCYGLCNTCHGPLPTDCDSCNTIKGAVSLRPNGCSCAKNYYYSEEIGRA